MNTHYKLVGGAGDGYVSNTDQFYDKLYWRHMTAAQSIATVFTTDPVWVDKSKITIYVYDGTKNQIKLYIPEGAT